MPKDTKSLDESRTIRQFLTTKWGRVPSSIFRVEWKKSDNIELMGREYSTQQKDNASVMIDAFKLSGTGARHNGLSRYPQDLGSFLTNFYCVEHGTVFDPFAGHNSRMEMVYRTGRSYIGFDISHQFMDTNFKIRKILLEEKGLFDNPATIKLHECDSRRINEHYYTEIADFAITSPPFYDIEDYGDEDGQLGKLGGYDDFLVGLKTVFKNVYTVLKPKCFFAVECNDFRDDGKFYAYHADTIRILEEVGFNMHDVQIVDYGSGFMQAFVVDIERLKITSKEHAYVIVVSKGYKPVSRLSVQENVLATAASTEFEGKQYKFDGVREVKASDNNTSDFASLGLG